MFRIEMLPAGYGDGLLLAYGDPGHLHYVLIDGGPYYAYRNKRFVKRKTLSNRMRRLLDEDGQLELLVTTHVDADHIEAAVKLLGERPRDLAIQDVWFNGWRHLAPAPKDLLGPVHGEMLSALIQKQGLPWNAAFDGKSVVVRPGQAPPTVTLPGGLVLTLLSPTPETLLSLRDTWEDDLRTEGLDPDSPDQALERLEASKRLRPEDLLGDEHLDIEELAEEPFEGDDSKANGSSIAFLAEFENRRCLFAGDAHSSVLEASLRRVPLASGETRLHLNAFKIPHHGSRGNISQELLELVDCERYLVSTNGSYYEHPDQEAMARIIIHDRGSVLHFNYRSEENTIWDDDDLKREYQYQTVYPQGADQGLVIEL
jgi:hypothetical protein